MFSLFAVNGVVPNLALIVVVAAAIARGPAFGATIGFLAGMLLDLAPPADHVAGRWALAFVLIADSRRPGAADARRSPLAGLATVAVCSFVGDLGLRAQRGRARRPRPPARRDDAGHRDRVLWDVVMTPLLLPMLMALFERTRPAELAY